MLIRIGKSERARRAIMTHTGGPAQETDEIAELFRAHHVIEVPDLVELTETLAAFQAAKPVAGRRIAIITSSGGLSELILDIAAARDLELPPLSPEQKTQIEGGIGFITGDGNPCDAWGSGAFAANLPKALVLFDASEEHDAIVLLRDNLDDQLFDRPETARSYIEMFARAAEHSRKPHYLLTTRPGIMDRGLVAYLRGHGVGIVGGLGEGLSAIDRLAVKAN